MEAPPALASSSSTGTTVKMAHIRRSSNNNSNGLSGSGNVMKYDDRDKNDSANFSLTSSNESENNQQQYVTSIV
uniref:Uncharacterized protein n=1 Tax=Romanomermis culicivorax TaxID=13658 RepID=A0A915HX31_ROMCU